MKQLIILSFIFCAACNNNKQVTQQTSTDSSKTVPKNISADITIESKNIWVDRLNNKKYSLPDSMGGKPVSFFLANPKVAAIAKSFYNGQFRPTDNDSTTQLLSYVTTNDSTTRPFYRWCLDFTIFISDGALGEYPGSPALKYAIKFPKEFFDYMDKDKSGKRYRQWVELIAYSGLDDYDKGASEIEKGIISKMLKNCSFCVDEIQNRVTIFAKDITKAIKLQD